MNTDFLAGILVARMLEGMQFAVGPTIAARRSALASIGGFDRLKDYLAEDFVMGKFAAEAGHGVILSSGVVEHHIGSTDFAHNAAHRLRWTRSTRRSRPWGYMGQLFTMPLPLAIALVAADAIRLAVRACRAGSPLRRGLHRFRARAARETELAACCRSRILPYSASGCAGFFGKTIIWRGRRYLLHSDGRFELIPASNNRRPSAKWDGSRPALPFLPRQNHQSALRIDFPNCIGKLVAP